MNQRALNPVDPVTERALINSDEWKSFAENIIRFYQVSGYDTSPKSLDVNVQVNRFFKDRNTAMFLEITGIHAQQLEGMNFDIATYPVFKDSRTILSCHHRCH